MRISIGKIGLEGILKLRRHHCDDLIIRTVQLNGAVQYIRASAEHGDPERMADYSNFRMCGLIVFPGKGAAEFLRRLQGREEVAVNPRPTDTLRCALLRHAEFSLFEAAHIRVGLGLALEVVEVAIAGEDDLRRNLEAGIRRKQINQALRVSIR